MSDPRNTLYFCAARRGLVVGASITAPLAYSDRVTPAYNAGEAWPKPRTDRVFVTTCSETAARVAAMHDTSCVYEVEAVIALGLLERDCSDVAPGKRYSCVAVRVKRVLPLSDAKRKALQARGSRAC